ncbi:MAG: ATP-binding domain-containing protein, partial [Rhodospirillaceae bacterium]|nr:ATP-binding domain-containing protein [Rhodospirillaceae bacterium]
EFEERFITIGVPYRVIGGPRFYEREEIRDALAYLRVIHQSDDDLALERIINKPARGVGKTTLQAMHILARIQDSSLYAAGLQLIETDELRPQARRKLAEILGNFDLWRRMADGLPHAELAETVLDESGYMAFWMSSKRPEAPGKLENLKELIPAMREFENLAGFLEHVSLVMENIESKSGEMVSLMTLHSAKGLEFDSVFLPGWEEDLFPHKRSLDENGEVGLEEERRLAYVGLTRARQRVHISYAANRRIYNQWLSAAPSRFIDELPKDEIEVKSEPGLYGTRGDGFGGASPHASSNSLTQGGPGWRRFQERGPGATLIEATAVTAKAGPSGFAVGERCFHQKFGMGVVRAADGDKLTIDFDKAGQKKVIAAFVQKP